MFLPIVAFVFAVVGAVAGNLLPISQGYYKTGATSCSTTPVGLDQANCQTNLDINKPVCTVNVIGHPTAFNNNICSEVLRYNP